MPTSSPAPATRTGSDFSIDLDDDRDNHRATAHLLVEELAQRVADRVLDDLPFRVAAPRLVDGAEHLLAGRLEQRVGRLLMDEAPRDEIGTGDHLSGVLVDRHDHDEDAVLGEHAPVA